jgi:leucyl/phenylalanyl-tRNA--protein transferase
MEYDVAAIIRGYAQGYFLMADEHDYLGWYGSNEHTLIPLDERFRYTKSLQRVLNQERFRVAINGDFSAVVAGCTNRTQTWISAELKKIYWLLYQSGYAYSFEAWQGDKLAGEF